MNTYDFIQKAVSIHGNKYDYSKAKYVSSHTPVEIICPIHGSFYQSPNSHIGKRHCGCQKCGGTKRLTTEEFILKAKEVHGEKFDYSKVVYKNGKTKIEVVCKKHGSFFVTPNMHLSKNKHYGCPKCATEKKRGLVHNVGIYDVDFSMLKDEFIYSAYKQWSAMLGRCYSNYVHSNQKTYQSCKTCDEWHKFSNFFEWYKLNSVDGYMLDKDILFKGNKLYSPDTCCFVPNDINIIFSHKTKQRSLPIGVTMDKARKKYVSRINKGHNQIHIGTFNTAEEAFLAYKQAKEDYIKEVANKWKNRIAPNVYDAMMRYEVEITD